MAWPSLRKLYKRGLLRLLYRPGPLPSGSAVVFAPHQDDETLGCGGTILRKRQAGAPVWIVFLTDGSRSHRSLMSKEAMKSMRMQEALNAGRVLGVPPENIRFLQFPNGALHQHQDEARAQVQEFLLATRPAEVYIPSPLDFHSEHRVTALAVMDTLKQLRAGPGGVYSPILYEYPVWFWYQWPWVAGARNERAKLLKRGLRYGFGAVFLARFRCVVPIGQVLGVKRTALDQHVSQTRRMLEDPGWQTLQDVANGEFVDCFFQDYEIFRRTGG